MGEAPYSRKHRLFEEPYWTRTWIVQELLQARRTVYHYQGICWGEASMQNAIQSAASREHRALHRGSCGPFPLLRSKRLAIKDLGFGTSLFDLFQILFQSRCSDPKDRVFALLALLPREEQIALSAYCPDYSLTHDAVVLITLAHLRTFGKHTITEWNSHEIFEALGVQSAEKRRCFLEYGASPDLENTIGPRMLLDDGSLQLVANICEKDLSSPRVLLTALQARTESSVKHTTEPVTRVRIGTLYRFVEYVRPIDGYLCFFALLLCVLLLYLTS